MDSIYIRLIDARPNVLTANGTFEGNIAPVKEILDTKTNQFIKVSSYSSDVEQTLNIGSQSAGAGAGKMTFNPFSIKRTTDTLTPVLFQNAAAGTHFKTVEIFFVNAQNFISVRHTYKLVGIKTISWSAESGEPGLMETVSFEYGALIITINQQGSDGRLSNVFQGGWNRVKNVKDVDLNGPVL
jgi:type VI secretion system secreted protein Hcp